MQNYELIGPSGSLFIIETETENRVKMQQIIAKYINKVIPVWVSLSLALKFNFLEKFL